MKDYLTIAMTITINITSAVTATITTTNAEHVMRYAHCCRFTSKYCHTCHNASYRFRTYRPPLDRLATVRHQWKLTLVSSSDLPRTASDFDGFEHRTSSDEIQSTDEPTKHATFSTTEKPQGRVRAQLVLPKPRHTELLWFGHLHWHPVSLSLCSLQPKCDSTLCVFFAHRASRGTPSIFDWDRGAKVEDFLSWAKLKTVNFWACFDCELPLQDAVKSNVLISVIVKVSEAASRAAGVPMHLAFDAPVGATLPPGTDCAESSRGHSH